MHRTTFHRGKRHPLAPAALLLLALCLLAAGAQAANETANTSVPVAGDGRAIDGIVLTPTATTIPTTPVPCGYADAYPMPNFTVDRTSGTAPLTVQFIDASSEWAYDWHWDFGDGSNSTEQNPVHTFASMGVYPVTLTINEHDHFVNGCMWVHYWNDPRYGKKTVQVTVEGNDPSRKPLPIPGRIQAEDYDTGGEGVSYHDTTAGNSGGAYRNDNVDIETADGITDVGWIRTGEYLVYTVNVTQAGDYRASLRVASPNSGRRIEVSVDGTQGNSIWVPNTGSFEAFTTTGLFPNPSVTATVTPAGTGNDVAYSPIHLEAGTHTVRLLFWGDGQNLDWFELALPPTPGSSGTPYTPLAIPGTIQAEDYNLGGEGVAYHDATPGNDGGAYRQDGVDIETGNGITNVGWIRNGEWLAYTATVAQTGTYTMTARVASPNSGRAVTVLVDGTLTGTLAVPNTGSFATFRTVDVPVTLTAGTHTLKLTFAGDGQNIDSIAFAAPAPTPAPYVTVGIPGTIQAENYDLGGEGVAFHETHPGNEGGAAYRDDDVDITEIPGGYAVVSINHDEWLVYTIDSVYATPELPALVLYMGAGLPGCHVDLEVNGRAAGSVDVPWTGSPTTFVPVQTQVVAEKGTLRLRFHGNGMGLDRIESPAFTSYADDYNRANFTADRTNGTAPLAVRFNDTSSKFAYEWAWDFGDGQSSTEQNPVHTFLQPGVHNVTLNIKEHDRWVGGTYVHIWNDLSHGKTVPVTVGGTGPSSGHTIPGTIQAEDYDLGGEGVAYHDTTPQNEGGAYRQDGVDIESAGGITNVGWIRDGEYLTFTVNAQYPGPYALTARVASPNSGRKIGVSVDGTWVGSIWIPNTGSFEAFRTEQLYTPLVLMPGPHTVRLTFLGDGQNLDWMKVQAGTPEVTPSTTTTTPVPSGGASFTAVPTSAPYGSAVKFTVTPATGKTVASAWWSFDSVNHLSTWNSRGTNPTFFYPAAGTYSPLVKITYADGSTETVQRTGYVTAT